MVFTTFYCLAGLAIISMGISLSAEEVIYDELLIICIFLIIRSNTRQIGSLMLLALRRMKKRLGGG